MLITSARRSVNSEYVAEASFYEGEVCVKTEYGGRKPVECDVISLTFSSGKVSYYSPIKDISVCPDYHTIECHCEPLFFADLLAFFFSLL